MPRKIARAAKRFITGAARGGGRPLDEAVDAAILKAAVQLLQREGYARMSIAGVAEAAGVGRPAIYRRYRDKSELVLAAIELMRTRVPDPDTGHTRADLAAFLDMARQKFDMSLMGTLLVEEDEHPELLHRFRERMIGPFHDNVAAALERGKIRGEVKADLDVPAAVDAVMGSFIQHYLATGRPPSGWAEQVIALLWPAFAVMHD